MPTTIDGTTGVSLVQDASITTAKLVDSSVTAPKLLDASVTQPKMAPNAVDVQVKALLNAAGSAPVFGCRAWCNFDGTLTGTNAPRAGGNVASVTRNSTGDYTIIFTTAMPDANYAVNITIGGVTNCYLCRTSEDATPRTASVFRINCVNGNNTATIDPPQISIVVSR